MRLALRRLLDAARHRRPGDGRSSASSAAPAPGARAGLIGAGAVAVILGVSLFSPRLVPAAGARSPAGRWNGAAADRPPGPREHPAQPGRTAVTAAALMIGLAARRLRHRLRGRPQELDRVRRSTKTSQGELVIQNTDGFSPISSGAAAAARNVPGVELVATMRTAQAKLVGGGGKPKVSSLPPDADEVLAIDWTEGGSATLRELDEPRGDPRQVVRRRPGTRSRGQHPAPDPDRETAEASRVDRRIRRPGRTLRQRDRHTRP